MNKQTITEPQRFASDIFWVATSNMAVPLVGLITLPVMTKNYPAETYAVWVQSFLIVGLLSFVLNLCLGNAVVRFLASEDNIEKRRRALGAMLWPAVASACLSLTFSLWLRQDLSAILFATTDYANIVPVVFLWSAVQSVNAILTGYLMARRKIRKVSIFQICRVLYQTLMIVILALSGIDLIWIIAGVIAGEATLGVITFTMIVKEIRCPWPSLEGLRGYLAFSIPLVPSGILFWVISSSDRFFITYLLNLGQTGLYSASLSVGNLIFLFYSPIPPALFPVLSRLWERKDMAKVSSYLEYSNKLYITLAVPGAAGLYILSQPLLAVFTTPAYMVGGSLVLLVAVATLFCGLYQINVSAILLAGQTRWLMTVIAIATLAGIGLNLTLIPAAGIMGAAIALSVAYLILAGTVIIWARKVTGYKISIQFLAKVVIGSLLMAWCISYISLGGILGIIIITISGVVLFSLWMWLTRAFSSGDKDLVKEIITGLKQGTIIR